MIYKPPPFKGLDIRIPIIIPIKGRGFINHGSTLREKDAFEELLGESRVLNLKPVDAYATEECKAIYTAYLHKALYTWIVIDIVVSLCASRMLERGRGTPKGIVTSTDHHMSHCLNS